MADYDLAIIGGGLNGTSMARDAAASGLNRLLLDQFGARHSVLKTVSLRQTAVSRLRIDMIPESLQAFKG